MARKKRVKKSPSKKKKMMEKPEKFMATKRKINLVIKNLIFFAILTAASYFVYTISWREVYVNFFNLLWIILGFISLALLLVLLILLFLRLMKK